MKKEKKASVSFEGLSYQGTVDADETRACHHHADSFSPATRGKA
jgi:hypothetical protein